MRHLDALGGFVAEQFMQTDLSRSLRSASLKRAILISSTRPTKTHYITVMGPAFIIIERAGPPIRAQRCRTLISVESAISSGVLSLRRRAAMAHMMRAPRVSACMSWRESRTPYDM